MPTYQYVCTECEHAFEQFQSFSDDSLTVCPQCAGRLRKVFNAVGVVFKGSGFYRTDNRTDNRTESSTAAASTSGGGTEAGTSSSASESSASTESSAPKTETTTKKSDTKKSESAA